MRQKELKVSVIIPAYNEEDRLAGCLKALDSQTVKPFEVILVDNNSSDQTVSLAKSYGFVKIVKETKQGIVYARDKGFDIAKGDIIARIDADSIVTNDWTAKIIEKFNSENVDAISGSGYTYTGVTNPLLSKIIRWAVYAHGKAMYGSEMMWGSNTAIKKSIWKDVRKLTIKNLKVHEDIDLALAISSAGYKIKIFNDLVVGADLNDIQYGDKFFRYYKIAFSTKRLHQQHPRFKLQNRIKFNWPTRVYYYAITYPFILSFVVLTGLNQLRKSLNSNLRYLIGTRSKA